MGDDGWAVYSEDGSLAAHFEFTVAVTADGPRILTPWHETTNAHARGYGLRTRRPTEWGRPGPRWIATSPTCSCRTIPRSRRRCGPTTPPACPSTTSRRTRAGCYSFWRNSPGARTVLEIGTLGGYSTIWLARALPDGGRLITLEVEPAHAEVARANMAHAGLAEKVEVRVGAASGAPRGEVEGEGPFDLIFVDADKPNNPEYLARALELSRRAP